MLDTKLKLSHQTIALHWVIALGMIMLLASGIYMHETDAYAIYPIHKSFGVLLFLIAIWRISWRYKNGWPEPIREYQKFEIKLSKIVHWILIIGTVMMPISGMMMSGMGGYGVAAFGLELIATNPSEADPMKMIPLNESLASLGHTVHSIGGKLIILALLLHVTGALKHHFIDKDDTLNRMKGKNLGD